MNKLLLASILLLSIGKSNSYPFGPSDCDLCQVFVAGGKNFLLYNHTVSEFKQYLENTCDFFGPYRNTCKDLVSSFTPKIIILINNNDTAVEVCSNAGVCDNYDDINVLFADIIQSVEAYDPTSDAYAAYAASAYASDDDTNDSNIIKPEVVSRPIIFEFIDFGDVADF
jgi:hypothetical protein